MNTIKELRLQNALTQKELAFKSGVSLRTIQRFESSGQIPKGHSLKVIAKALGVNTNALAQKNTSSKNIIEKELLSLKIINIAALGFFIFPFGNLMLSIILWRRNKSKENIFNHGRKIINFQLIWTLVFIFCMSVSPFINIESFTSVPLILIILGLGLSIKVLIVFYIAHKISHRQMDFLSWLPRLI